MVLYLETKMKNDIFEKNNQLILTCNFDVFFEKKDFFINFQLDTFDHVLTEKESLEKILSYPVLKKQDFSTYFEKEKKILVFLEKIFLEEKIFLCKNGRHFRIFSKKKFQKLCRESLREKKFSTFHVPSLDLTIYGSHDLSMGFSFLKTAESKISKLKKMIESFEGLYLL